MSANGIQNPRVSSPETVQPTQDRPSIATAFREMRLQQLGCYADTLARDLASDDVGTRRGAMSQLTERARQLGLDDQDAVDAARRVWRAGQQQIPGEMPDFNRDQFCTSVGPGVMPRLRPLSPGQGLERILEGIRPNNR